MKKIVLISERVYNNIVEDEISEVTFVPSEGEDEKENQYWLDQTKLAVQRANKKVDKDVSNSSTEANPNFHLNLEFPNEIFNLYGNKHAVVLYSDETKSEIVFAVRYEMYRDGIRVMNTRSTPNVRGQKLALRTYIELKKELGVPLYSDFGQSPFSRYGIWEKLYKQSPNSVKAFDINKSTIFDVDMMPNKSGRDEMVYNDGGKIKPIYGKKDNGIILKYI